MEKEKIIKRLEEIRVELTEIYYDKLGNPANLSADSVLMGDIQRLEGTR